MSDGLRLLVISCPSLPPGSPPGPSLAVQGHPHTLTAASMRPAGSRVYTDAPIPGV